MLPYPSRLPSPWRLAVLACGATAIASPARVLAEEPILGGHRFVPSSIAAWSFVDTEVSSTSDAGVSDFAATPSNFPSLAPFVPGFGQRKGSYIAFDQTLGGSVAFLDTFSVDVRLSAGGLAPLNTSSALFIGVHGIAEESIGAAVRLVRTDVLQVTLRADFEGAEIESVVPARLPSSPRVSGHLLGISPAIAAALALTPRIGLQGSGVVELQRFDVSTSDDVITPVGAVAATFALDPAPLTALIGGSVEHTFSRSVNTTTADAVLGPDATRWNVEAGLYYTARPELDLGILGRVQLVGGDHNDRFYGLFRLGYYF
jgi:hypothetical protein